MKFKDLPRDALRDLLNKKLIGPGTQYSAHIGDQNVPADMLLKLPKNIVPKELAAQQKRKQDYDAIFVNEEGGIFKYSTELPTGPEGETKTYNWARNKPLSAQDFEYLEQVRKKDFPDRKPLEIKKTLVEGGEGSRKVFDYVVDNDLLEFPEGYTKEDKLAAYAAFPTTFREAAMGEEPSRLNRIWDVTSRPGRQVMARLNDPLNYNPYEQAKTTSDMGDEWWKFPAKMAGDIVRSPTFPLALMGSALAPMPSTFRGMMGREFTLGATEGIAEVEAARARKTMDPTLGDYTLGGTMGGGLSSGSQGMILAAPKMLGAYKASRAAKQTPSLGEMWGQVRQDVANIPGNVFMDAAKERARNLLRTKPGSAYEPGARAKYSEKLGIPPDQLYPGLGMANRSSQQMTDMRTLATKNKKIHDWWTNSYDKLLTGINKWTNYENAPSVSQSGTIIENSLEDATNTFYDKLDVTYAKVLDDPAMGFQVDAQFDAARVGQMHKELDALKKKYEDKMEKELQYETIKESVPDDYGNLVIKEKKGDIKRDKQGNPILQQNSTLNPSEAGELASAVKRIEGLRKSLNIRDAIAPGQNNEFVLNLNRGRSNLQKDIKNIPFMNRTGTGQSITADLRNLLSKHLTEATLAADPKIGAALVENNKLVDKFQTKADLLRKDLKNETRSSEDIGRSIMGNNTKMDALQYILGNYGKKGKFGEPIEFNRVRDSWFKNQVMRESPATGGISNKIAKPMGAHEEFVKKYYGPKVPFEDLQDYARGLLIIGDPQLIGLSGTLNQAGRDLANIPTSGRQALQYMQGLLKESTDPADLKKATKMIKDMEEANVIDFGASYAPKQPTTKLGTLVTRIGVGGTAARAPDYTENQANAPYNPRRSTFWEDQRNKYLNIPPSGTY
jgi:hypothetical protein